MPLSQGWIFIWWCGTSITRCAYQHVASHIKMTQITCFSCVSQDKKIPKHGEPKKCIRLIDACEWKFDFHIMVWCYHAFCLSRFGFTYQNFTNWLFFLCFLRNKDTYTWWNKNIYKTNWCLWVKFLFAYIDVVVSHVLPVNICLHTSKFHKITYFSCVFSGKKILTHGEPKTCIWQIDSCESRFDVHIVVW
jgi:hypothetical protein